MDEVAMKFELHKDTANEIRRRRKMATDCIAARLK